MQWKTGVPVLNPQSAGDLGGFCHQFGAVPDRLELLGYWELPLWNDQEQKRQEGSDTWRGLRVQQCLSILTYSSSPCGTRMFISELLALTMSQLRESLLRYTWQPSVLLMEMVGTLPSTCRWTFDWHRCMYVAEFALIKCNHLQIDSAQIYHNMCHTKPKRARLRCSESFSVIFLTCSWTAFELMISTIPTTFSNTKPSFLQLSERWKYTC